MTKPSSTVQFPAHFTHACTSTAREVPASAPVVNGFKIVRCDCGDTVFVGPVARLAELRDQAHASFEAAVVQAHADRLPISTIAAESGLSRQAIYDLLRRHGVR